LKVGVGEEKNEEKVRRILRVFFSLLDFLIKIIYSFRTDIKDNGNMKTCESLSLRQAGIYIREGKKEDFLGIEYLIEPKKVPQ
jgi:hypothetical protein